MATEPERDCPHHANGHSFHQMGHHVEDLHLDRLDSCDHWLHLQRHEDRGHLEMDQVHVDQVVLPWQHLWWRRWWCFFGAHGRLPDRSSILHLLKRHLQTLHLVLKSISAIVSCQECLPFSQACWKPLFISTTATA